MWIYLSRGDVFRAMSNKATVLDMFLPLDVVILNQMPAATNPAAQKKRDFLSGNS